MRVAIMGAGSIGLGYAAFFADRGHSIVSWSPSGAGVSDSLE